MVERIVVVGAGRSAGALVERLARLADVTVVDVAADRLPALEEGEPTARDSSIDHPIVHHVGDATSRIVLEDLRGDLQVPVALVVTTGDDRKALEVVRLAVDLKYRPVVAIVNALETARACEKLGARPFVKAQLVGQVVEQAIQQGGLGIGSNVGFGSGEIVEFTVMPSSPAIGQTLTALHPEGWRVAAIYRAGVLVLPTGRTTIQAEDRVLVVGDPKLLPHVVETLRIGVPTFPLLHGPNVVAYLPDGRDAAIEDPAELFALRTRAARLVRLYPGAETARATVVPVPTSAPASLPPRKAIDDAPLAGVTMPDHVASIRSKQPGLVVARLPRRSLGHVLFGSAGEAATLCNGVGVPVLFPRGSSALGRVVLGIADGVGDPASGDVALDLARMLEIPFCVMRVKLPGYLAAEQPEVAQVLAQIVSRASLHGVPIEHLELEGNPVREWMNASRVSDLFVLGRKPTSRDSYAKPYVALRFARAAKCSTMVCTTEPAT